jgi:hypothetical protein
MRRRCTPVAFCCAVIARLTPEKKEDLNATVVNGFRRFGAQAPAKSDQQKPMEG